jgi:tetratricopeptide (TPR) repeat protein
MQLVRRDVGYTIISRFEESFRSFLADKIPSLLPNYETNLPSRIIQKAKERSIDGNWDSINDFLENSDFPDLMEIVIFNGMYKSYFPGSEIQQAEFQSIMETLYELRCKIAHIKQYFNSLDLDVLSENSKKVAKNLDGYGKEFLDFLFELGEYPDKVIMPTPVFFFSEVDTVVANIPHNVPTPDYEFEGGYVGREDDIKKITSLLEGNLHRVITITGAGGVGKTALALRVIQKYLKSSKSKFDGIVWLSAKETKLSYLGIEDIEPTVKSYEDLLDTIIDVMGYRTLESTIEQKEFDLNALFDIHTSILIVIDNLETIRDERIINFILDAHPNTKILITSRTGLGQVERRHELKQLKEKEAVVLFRLIARDKRLTYLHELDDETVKSYVKKVACYPLAIKWVIGQVAVGKDINIVINLINETTSDISRFCFDQVYGALSESAKKILCTLSMFDDPPPSGVLNYVLNIPGQSFDDGARELILVSLVIPEQYKTAQNEISSKYALLSLTRGYVRQQLDKEPILKRDIAERLQTVQTTIEEADRAQKQYRFGLSNLGATTEEEKIAAMLATTAHQKYQSGRYSDAVEDYKRANKIAPRFASIYRNWAVMESQEGHSVEAEQLIKKASELSPQDPQIWLTWGNIKRKEDKVRDALPKYEVAFKLSPEDSIVLNSLGQAKARLGEYEEADKIFHMALDKEASGDSLKHRVINLSSLADNLLRWSDFYEKGRDYVNAEKKLRQAVDICIEVIDLDTNDTKSQDLYRLTLIKLGYLYLRNKDTLAKAVHYFGRAIVNKPVKNMRVKEKNDTLRASIQLARLFAKANQLEKAKSFITPELRKIVTQPVIRPNLQAEFTSLWDELYNPPIILTGKIIRTDLEGLFVIIESLTSPGSTYIGRIKNFENQDIKKVSLLLDRKVSFIPIEETNDAGLRKEGKSIKLLD